MSDKFNQWAVLEIMGHQRYAGRVSEETIAGVAFLRIDIPAKKDQPEFTKLFSPSSVYAITPCSEELARGVAENLSQEPISVYELPQWMQDRLRTKQLPLTLGAPSDDDFDDDASGPF